MKACSFLPAATKMIYDMELQHLLCGVTFECPAEALREKPKLVMKWIKLLKEEMLRFRDYRSRD